MDDVLKVLLAIYNKLEDLESRLSNQEDCLREIRDEIVLLGSSINNIESDVSSISINTM
ncbi:hypothetical protein [Clostridium paraputrificum]|uniref:hypothetical protein n=1 Tax=Clostridium paraputrificum TaxID=29363 RepID=UPI0003F6554A|nr:hypothetical protein [Clostridium paraputrificum]